MRKSLKFIRIVDSIPRDPTDAWTAEEWERLTRLKTDSARYLTRQAITLAWMRVGEYRGGVNLIPEPPVEWRES